MVFTMTKMTAPYRISLLHLTKRGQTNRQTGKTCVKHQFGATSARPEGRDSELLSKKFMLQDTVFTVLLATYDSLVVDIVGCFVEVEQGRPYWNFELLT